MALDDEDIRHRLERVEKKINFLGEAVIAVVAFGLMSLIVVLARRYLDDPFKTIAELVSGILFIASWIYLRWKFYE
jgi:uncharacterized membrane protein YqjE